jgi:mannose-6-phosphate isomerase
MEILNIEKVKADDVYFLPAGRVHYIGKGCLLAEIQQSSDVTYRIYDFDRKDDNGISRELHTEESIDAIDFTHHTKFKTEYIDKVNDIVKLVSCPYFTTNKLHYNSTVMRNFSDLDSFVIYVCMSGEMIIDYGAGSLNVKMGEAILVPAAIKKVSLKPVGWFKLLESYIT